MPSFPHRAQDTKCPPIDAFVLSNHVVACCLSVAHAPQAGETVLASAMTQEAGGKGLNVALGLGRLGLRVASLTATGHDAAGDGLVALFERERQPLARCLRLGEHSGFGIGLVDDHGDNRIAVFPGAGALLTASHVRDHAAAAIAHARLVYGTFESSTDALAETLRLGRDSGAFNVLNPSPWRPMPAPFWALCDGIVVNEGEAVALLGLPEKPANWQAWLHEHPELSLAGAPWTGQWLVITLGASGALMWRRQRPPRSQAAMSLPHPVDTTGCGDAFTCGLLAALAQAHSDATALQWGVLCGAHMASHAGVLASLPDRSTLEGLLQTGTCPQGNQQA